MKPEVAGDRDRVGPYLLVKAIGAGGSARIDLARIDRAYGFQRHVVIKRPLEHLRADAKAAASLRREANIGARLRHPNLVAILDAGVHDGYDYLVLEYVHGGSLRTLMQTDAGARVRDCAPNVAIAIVGDVARGLHDAHELADDAGHPLGLVHRDVSPGNILIGLDGSVKLADFGIAKETRVQTLSGSMHGTVTYMAPEQCRGHAFDRRADVFSLGVILYELVTGTRLFWADNDVASLHRVLSGNVPRPRKLRPAISSTLEDIVMTAVAHEQDKRFTTARDLADALEIYAGEAGEILGARWIARWVHDILGPREVPWIGAPTIIDVPAAVPDLDDTRGSLVPLIEAMPIVEEPPNPTFGPTTRSFSDEVATKPRRSPPVAKSRKVLASVIALGLVGGAGVTAFVMSRDDAGRSPAGSNRAPANESSKGDPPTRVAPAKVDPPATIDPPALDSPAKVDLPATIDPPAVDSRVDELAADKVRPKRRRPTGDRSAADKPTTDKPTTDHPTVDNGSATPVADDSKSRPSAGSGSQRGTSKVEWNPTMLLPTDSGSGTKKK